MQKKTNKVNRKYVEIVNSNLEKKRLMSKYSKFQQWISKRFKLELADTYQYLFRIQYKGRVRLKVGDAVVNSQGVIFSVVMESNRLAMLASIDNYMEKPVVRGKLTILEKSTNEIAKDREKERNLKVIK